MSDNNTNDTGTLETILFFAGIYLLLQGIVNKIALANWPGKLSALGVVGMQIFYYLALAAHVTGHANYEKFMAFGNFFAVIYGIAVFAAICTRIRGSRE